MVVVDFQYSFLDAAAEILSARHIKERLTMPILPASFEKPEHARRALEALLEKEKGEVES